MIRLLSEDTDIFVQLVCCRQGAVKAVKYDNAGSSVFSRMVCVPSGIATWPHIPIHQSQHRWVCSQDNSLGEETVRFTLFIKKKNVPRSNPCLQNQPICFYTCCGPICRSRCIDQQTSRPHPTSQPIPVSSARRAGMASQPCYCLD